MARGGFPSMTALLGLLAVAGFQNRDKISEILANRQSANSASDRDGRGELPEKSSGRGTGRALRLDGLLGGFVGGAGIERLLGGGLSELADRFRQSGRAETVESWVGTGPNKDLTSADLSDALGPDTLAELSEQTGLSRDEVLARLTRELPGAVDQYTPQGRLPMRNG